MTDGRDDDLLGETLAGRYAVLARVARGGFGVVYRGRHVELDAPVAIKVLTATDRYAGEARAEWLAMFQREARTLAALNHPALVRVLDYGSIERNGRTLPWMALEWLEGITLEADLASRRGEGRSPREVLELMRPAFDALACAHEAGVSHRDIKPSNLMLVAAKRGAPSLRVIDFGVAKIDDSDPTARERRHGDRRRARRVQRRLRGARAGHAHPHGPVDRRARARARHHRGAPRGARLRRSRGRRRSSSRCSAPSVRRRVAAGSTWGRGSPSSRARWSASLRRVLRTRARSGPSSIAASRRRRPRGRRRLDLDPHPPRGPAT